MAKQVLSRITNIFLHKEQRAIENFKKKIWIFFVWQVIQTEVNENWQMKYMDK